MVREELADAHSPDAEKEKLLFEKQKWTESLLLEKEKIRLEHRKIWFSAAAIVIPVLILAGTIYANTKAQIRQSQDAFELKVVDIVLSSDTVTESQNRVDAIATLFPGRLPKGFSELLRPLAAKLRRPVDKRALLNLLVSSPREQRQEILDLWLLFYPADREHLPPFLFELTATQEGEGMTPNITRGAALSSGSRPTSASTGRSASPPAR